MIPDTDKIELDANALIQELQKQRNALANREAMLLTHIEALNKKVEALVARLKELEPVKTE